MRKRMLTWTLALSLAVGGAAACAPEADDGDASQQDLGATFKREDLFNGNWTNWHVRNQPRNGGMDGVLERIADKVLGTTQRAKIVGLLKLGDMREWLLEENLFDTNPTAKVEKIGQADVRCDDRAKTFRRIDGTCNDLSNTAMGAANVRFGRNVPIEATEMDKDLLVPNPREVSRKLLSRPLGRNGEPVVQEVPFLNLLALTWIQYMNHDWFSHGSVDKEGTHANDELIEIPLAPDDPFKAAGNAALFARKTETRAPDVKGRPLTYYNENTHWWDGSQLYGSSKAVADSLRVKQGAALKAELDLPDGYLPVVGGQEQSGFVRNWWTGMSLMHTLFAREHNAIVAKLRSGHPDMSEDDLYDRARMINAAVMAKIHTIEWTPSLLPNPVLNLGMHSNWYGVKTTVAAEMKESWFGPDNVEGRSTDLKTSTVIDKFAKFFKLNDAGINGIVGGTRDLGPNNVPYTLTEEFTSVYRLHSLLPEKLAVKGAGTTVAIKDTRDKNAAEINRRYTLSTWMSSFGNQKPGQLVLHNYPAFMQDLEIPGFNKYDMGAIDILRDRERGVPRYNAFRKLIRLKPLASIDDLTDDPTARRELKEVYGNDIDKVDLLVGTLAEGHRPEFFGFGETQFQIFIVMASRRLMADRFFTESFNEETYTKEGLDWVRQASMKRVIVRNFPELASQLNNVENAFMPWDGSAGKAVPVKYADER